MRITASIYNPFAATRSMPTGTAEEQTKFKAGDEIFVHTFSSQRATYRFDGSAWTPKDGKYLLWKDDYQTETFVAFYPAEWALASVGGALYVFPTDQSSKDKIAKADLMQTNLNQTKTKEALHFTMWRFTARLIVKIAGFNSEFPADAKVENVEFHNQTYGAPATYTPYAEGEGEAGSTYTVLVREEASDHTVSLTVDGKVMTAKLQDYSYDRGKSYTYRLTVGKEKLEPGEVTVADWSGSTVITGGEAVD
ncbi:fimbrillin family protein [Phocaeicola abscessus]